MQCMKDFFGNQTESPWYDRQRNPGMPDLLKKKKN